MTDFGVLMFPTDYAVQPVELARASEARGFESIFFPEHTHIPASRQSPWPGGRDLPKEYWHTHDPMVALAAAAAATDTIKLGTGIALVTERDPLLMAKQVASLDYLSNGRVLLGIGAGWNAEEMENHGTAFKTRWKVLRERVLAMREVWREEEAEYHGDFVDFDPVWSYPKPKQPGGPKIFMGASSKWTWDRIAEYCDGWFPIFQDPSRAAASGGINYADGIQAVNEAWQRCGRSGKPEFCVFGVGPQQAAVEQLIELGFDRVVFGLPPADANVVMPLLDQYAELAGRFSS